MDSTTQDDVVFIPQIEPEAVVVDLLDDSFVFEENGAGNLAPDVSENSVTTFAETVKSEVSASVFTPPVKKPSATSTSKKRSLDTNSNSPEQPGASSGASSSHNEESIQSPVDEPKRKIARKEQTPTPQKTNTLRSDRCLSAL